ncbi:hypothetical protein GGF46_004117 [Coemansia sp. RSA 552]|nr:hypothetical protein GGF46_004117 [Coemansia sp. RSA 552]
MFAFARRLPRPLLVQRRWNSISPQSAWIGMVIEHKGQPHVVSSKELGGTGRGKAVIKLGLRHAVTGAQSQERFTSGEKVPVVTLSTNEYQYLYSEGTQAHLMNMETFEEIVVDHQALDGGKERLRYLKDGMKVLVRSLDPEPGPLTWSLPARFTYTLTEVGNTMPGSTKGTPLVQGTLDTGVRIAVPSYCKTGDTVVVDLQTQKFVSRE